MGLGELFSLLSAAAWAVGVILYRRLGETLPPLSLNFFKNSLVLGALVPVTLLIHGISPPDFTLMQCLTAMASGLIGLALADTLYFRALNELGAARMGILGNLYSPFVILFSFVFLGETLTAMQCGGFVLVTAGVVLVARSRAKVADEPSTLAVAAQADASAGHALGVEAIAAAEPRIVAGRGVLLGALAMLLMAAGIVMVKPVLEAQPLLWVTLVRLVGALLGLVTIALLRGELAHLDPRRQRFDLRTLLFAALFGQCLAMLLWLAGYKYTQASIAAILNETSSVFILLLAWLWLREPLGRRGVVAVLLTLGGVALMLL